MKSQNNSRRTDRPTCEGLNESNEVKFKGVKCKVLHWVQTIIQSEIECSDYQAALMKELGEEGNLI